MNIRLDLSDCTLSTEHQAIVGALNELLAWLPDDEDPNVALRLALLVLEAADIAPQAVLARVVGLSNRIVMQIVIVEGVFVGLVSWLLASLLALPQSKLTSVMVGINFIKVPVDFAFATGGISLWLIIVVILSVFASYLPACNASRIRVREALEYE